MLLTALSPQLEKPQVATIYSGTLASVSRTSKWYIFVRGLPNEAFQSFFTTQQPAHQFYITQPTAPALPTLFSTIAKPAVNHLSQRE
jgi:hypothetical protein